MKKFLTIAVFSFFLCVCFAACGQASEETLTEGEPKPSINKAQSMEQVAVLAYELPGSKPSILISFRGYQAKREKQAVFTSAYPIDSFQVRRAADDQVVLEKKVNYTKAEDGTVGTGSFTELVEEGEYYIFAKGVGRSKSFHIGKSFFAEEFWNMTDKIRDKARENQASLHELAQLLMLYEWYPNLFSDEDENGIPQVLEFLAGWSEREENATLLTAAVMAKFSFLFQDYDRKLATKLLNKASTIFEQEKEGQGTDADYFFALTELYRATGRYEYRKAIEEYVEYFRNHIDFLNREGYLYGAMTYLTTYQKVNLELCNLLMEQINRKAEENAESLTKLTDPATGKNNGPGQIFEQACIVVAANYIMNNPEYNRIVEKVWDYFSGQNIASLDSVSQCEDYAGYLLLLGQLYAVEERL